MADGLSSKRYSNFQSTLEDQLDRLIADSREKSELIDRLHRWGADLEAGLAECYDIANLLEPLASTIAKLHLARSAQLHQRDRERLLEPDWFQRPKTVGYVAYADLFAGDLAGVEQKIPYLRDLGISYLHLMPLLQPRPGENDGGYAVMDYGKVRDDLGTMTDLARLAEKLHDEGISLTLDLVLNHVAKEHHWAMAAKAGDSDFRDYFYVYPDRTEPDQYEETLPEIFPDFAPGSFSYDSELDGWVWTTFNNFQWDLNWGNPKVFIEFVDIIGNLANHGVDCLRLDAIAFIWKRLGTTCQGEPEVHAITQALRSIARIVSPALIFKAEAIVGPGQVGAYLGEGSHAGRVSDLAYHNSLMVQVWSSIAAKDGRLMELALSRFKALPSNTAWATYLRCHDDIGWAIDDHDAWQVGLNGHQHRMFLADYYTGKYFGSLALGEDFQVDPESGERRTSGASAALLGVEKALAIGDDALIEESVRRYVCAYAMIFGFGGIPLLYMGDELALPNDHGYLNDTAKRADNRWLNRPRMDWDLVAALAVESDQSRRTRASRSVNGHMRQLIATRKELESLHAVAPTTVKAGSGHGIVIYLRNHPAGNLAQIFNLGDGPRWVNKAELGANSGSWHDVIGNQDFELSEGFMLQPYEFIWLLQK